MVRTTYPLSVRPFEVGPHVQVKPYEGPLRFEDGERLLHDSLAREQVRSFGGTRIRYYALNIARSATHTLYNESTQRYYDGPYFMAGYIEWPKSQPEVREEGFLSRWETRVWIPRVEVETAGCRAPLEGDVVEVWRTPFFDEWAVSGEERQDGGYFFTVTVSNEEGHLHDSPGFIGFELTVARNTEFTPERRVDNRR